MDAEFTETAFKQIKIPSEEVIKNLFIICTIGCSFFSSFGETLYCFMTIPKILRLFFAGFIK